jgi:hypothetical protein
MPKILAASSKDADSDFSFPLGPAGLAEWPGTSIGEGNVITRIKGRTSLHDKSLDRDPAARDALLDWTSRVVDELGNEILSHDAIVHGLRVRLFTNSAHQHDFFVRNWYAPGEWFQSTGRQPPETPALTAYALINIPDRPEAAYYSREKGIVLFVNSSYYGQLKSWVLGAVGRLLSEEVGIHSIHGACVELNGTGILYVAPTGTGKSTSSYGLMTLEGSRFHSDDWVYVRYTIPDKQGSPVSPTVLPGPKGHVAGHEAIELVMQRGVRPGDYKGFDLLGHLVEGSTADLELAAPLSAYAFTSERLFYLRSNLVESFAPATPALLGSVFENVPDVSPEYLSAQSELIAMLKADIDTSQDRNLAESPMLPSLLARMFAFDNARAMLDTSRVFGSDRVFTNPMEPTPLKVVFLLKRDFDSSEVLAPLDREAFLGTLLIGKTPSGTEETAYNAYRAVDDRGERAFIATLHGRSPADVGNSYQAHRASAPDTLRAEMTLFSALHRATRCYSLNTILQRDPEVTSRKEAVRRTLSIINAVARGTMGHTVHLSDYHSLIGQK